ncbi:type IV toxin-antitoxin system AbiEi family antitoxin [Coleofasciculus sp. FACHB-SPT9]|uniref:type IV toxin-antitoxin system AbiEi family antitoxin n=1 Tax=Cyanophyceae TaxID=3028117 RepID=UPI0016836A22|nr:type IV toxin-antitoxin system AbiEi family antitoxin [Coleofasciculus sp. FACHB-SPT9]MBD1888923.1 hypothetical protein [Coleofasciculus sp. FACHB-SPT9]
MQPKHPLLQKCLKLLESLPNLQAKVEALPYITDNLLADGRLILYGSGQQVEYVCEIKSDITSGTIDLIVDYLLHIRQRLDDEQRPLLVTQNLSERVVDRLLKKNIEFIDTTGNIYLNSPITYILVRRQSRSGVTSNITNSSLQLIYVLLKFPHILKEEDFERELAVASGISLSTVRHTLEKLYKLDYLQRKRGDYRIVDYIKLLERWEMGYVESLRSKLLIDTFTPVEKRPFYEIADTIARQAQEYGYLIGGELGAALATDYLRPIGATLHVPEDYRPIFVKLKLKPSPQGEIALLRQFGSHNAWNCDQFTSLVDPVFIHAELQTSNDDRLRETAERLFGKYIAQRANDA